MTEGWRTATLGGLTEQRPICYGVLKPGKRQSTGVPLVRISDIGKNYVDVSDIYLITSNLSNEFRRSILKGDEILLSIQGTIGRVAICPPHLKGANVSRTIAVIEPNERIDRGFLRYWLLSMNGSFPVGGATRDSLNIGDIRNLVAPLPPLSEQQRIVAILDESFGGLATATTNAERNLANARELFDSYLNSVFTQEGERWREVSLSDVCAISSKLVDPREAKFIDLPHLGAGNMESKTGELADIKTAREERLKSGKFPTKRWCSTAKSDLI